MTRGNISIISRGSIFRFHVGSNAFPADTCPALEKYINEPDYYLVDLPELCNELGLQLGHVGNPCFIYELNLDSHTLTVWETKLRWVNAPIDWKEKGWNCYIGTNGKYGYHNWIKGKKVYPEK
jgi:hypothetical protein